VNGSEWKTSNSTAMEFFFFKFVSVLDKFVGVLGDYAEKLSRLSGTNEHFHCRCYIFGTRGE